MDFISIDIETTGLNEKTCQIIEFGACIVKNWEIVDTYRRTLWHPHIQGEPFALNMNAAILAEIASVNPKGRNWATEEIILAEDLPASFFSYLLINHYKNHDTHTILPINVAGKNFHAFDNRFLNELPDWENYFKIHRRSLDPSILYFDAALDTDVLPSLEQCKQRSGLFTDTTVKHRADKDAEDVAKLVIHKLKPNA